MDSEIYKAHLENSKKLIQEFLDKFPAVKPITIDAEGTEDFPKFPEGKLTPIEFVDEMPEHVVIDMEITKDRLVIPANIKWPKGCFPLVGKLEFDSNPED